MDYVVFPGPFAAEAKYVDTASTGDARPMLAKYGSGLMLTRSGIALDPRLTVIPAGVFAWLLDQGELASA